MECYDSVYGREPLGTSEIRVLRLEPASSLEPSAVNDPILATTEIISLDDDPEFTALSYCWGTGGFDHTMTCNGVPMNITESLDQALRWFRQGVADSFRNHSVVGKTTSLVIWADAVCINQNNVGERNAQVQLMGRIYSQAARVFIYLGEEKSSTSAGLALAGKLWDIAFDWTKQHPEMDPPRVLKSMPLPRNDHAGWGGLVDILTYPWFSRCWIIQEFCMCSNRIFVCGRTSFTWMLLDTVTRLIDANSEVSTLVAQKMEHKFKRKGPRFWDSYHLNSLFTLKAFAGTVATDEWFERLRQTRTPRPRIPLWDLLVMAGSKFDATNPRDKVYALMGMAADLDALPKPDYRLSVGETYEVFARHWVNSGKGMDVISIAGMERGEAGMSSWVPDWSTHPSPLTWNPFDNAEDATANAANGTEQAVHLDTQDPTKLLAAGAIVDNITHLSQAMSVKDIGQSDCHKTWITSARDTISTFNPTLSSTAVTGLLSNVITAGDPDVQVDDPASAFQALENATENYIHLNVMVDPPPYETALVKYKIYILSAVSIMSGTRLLVTEAGRFGLAPNPGMVGDEVCIFAGGKVPYLVRRKDEMHLLVGKAYVLGIMQGEALRTRGFELREITLA